MRGGNASGEFAALGGKRVLYSVNQEFLECSFVAVKRIGRWHSLLFWQFADPPGLDGWLDQLFQVLKTLRNKRTVSANARSVASGSKRGPSSRVKACSAGYRTVL